ncbi:microsomal dipeptidase-like Zn-dependent dipeptidase [Azospirillum fermentarium]|uniref:membrane dipeptidase n=1 Tax=Azospirillum fermentarium TaxID=1233114 RepID=UPI002226772C|nr:membrane dipeptidase [Azospirillum fermentarium]MCW2245188.1 microsomal dipeptidase-like Zn-dependent dipeptidase [Azospirillum fermentarium]
MDPTLHPVSWPAVFAASADALDGQRVSLGGWALVAGTGGVIGVWPPATRFPDLDAYAAGIARMAGVVGVEHVGVGSDMLGLVSASVFPSYTRLPGLRQALARQRFQPAETAAILGGNYARVFAAVTG